MNDAQPFPGSQLGARPAAHAVRLRPVTPDDLAIIYELQCDEEGNRMASTKPRTLESFRANWEQALATPGNVSRVILLDGAVVGAIGCLGRNGQRHVGYWIAREHWGKGIASRALALLLEEVADRPLHAVAASANLASRRVLEKCGFRLTGFEMGEESDRHVACEIACFVLES